MKDAHDLTQITRAVGRRQAVTLFAGVVMFAVGALGLSGHLDEADLRWSFVLMTVLAAVLVYDFIRTHPSMMSR